MAERKKKKKKNEAEISTRAFPLESPSKKFENKCNQRLPEQLMDKYPKFTFAPVAKRVFVRNYLYENMMSPVQSFA